MQIPTRVMPSSIHGFGCFAIELIPQGTVVWRYVEGFDSKNLIDIYDYKDNARFINHSRNPNTSPLHSNQKNDLGETVAIEDIMPDEEITEDYRQTVSSIISPTMVYL